MITGIANLLMLSGVRSGGMQAICDLPSLHTCLNALVCISTHRRFYRALQDEYAIVLNHYAHCQVTP